MTDQPSHEKKVHLYAPPPKDFDPFAASEKDLIRYGLPMRPDAHTQPELAALWQRQAERYRHYDHVEPQPDTATAHIKTIGPKALGLDAVESCGYQLFSTQSAPFTSLFVSWTVPDLQYTVSQLGTDYFHTFVGLGFLDLHVDMSVDSSQNVTAKIWAQNIGQINLPVRPGDVLNGSLCLQTNATGTASYFITNETTLQTINFTVNTGFPPAVTINAGVSRSWPLNQPFPPLARFGVVYFDEISAYTTSGARILTSGTATTMIGQNNRTLARPEKLNDNAFKAVFVSI